MKVLADLRIGQRLGLGFALVLLLSLLTMAVSLWRLQLVAEATRAMMQAPLAKERFIADWSSGTNASVRRTTAIAKSSDPSLATFFAEDTASTTKAVSEAQKGFEQLIRSDEERALFTTIGGVRQRFLAARDAVELVERTLERGQASLALSQEQLNKVSAMLTTSSTSVAKASAGVNQIGDAIREQTSATEQIARKVEAIAQVAETNHAAIEQSRHTAQSMQGVATRLRQAVDRFKV